MPYVAPEIRKVLTGRSVKAPYTGGELNFLITRMVNRMLDERGLNYSVINEIVGALECAKLELYRRVAAPYEDKKIQENGDVYSKENLTE